MLFRSAAALADAVGALAADPERRHAMAAQARAKAEAEFDQDTVIRITLDTYARLLGPRAPEAA